MRRAKLAWTLPWREKVGAKPIRLDLIFRTDPIYNNGAEPTPHHPLLSFREVDFG